MINDEEIIINISYHHFLASGPMVSGPITSWQIDGETVETVVDYFLGSKITADGNCRHEIKRRL